jgi:hypothetical protein
MTETALDDRLPASQRRDERFGGDGITRVDQRTIAMPRREPWCVVAAAGCGSAAV